MKTKNKSLVNKALEKKRSGGIEITAEHMELAVAFLAGKVTLSQAAFALGVPFKGTPVYVLLLRASKAAYGQGLIQEI